MVAAVVVTVVSPRWNFCETRDVGHVDVRSLYVEAYPVHRLELFEGGDRLAEHRPDGRLVVVALLRWQTLPAYEHRAFVRSRDELAVHVRRRSRAVAACADVECVLRETVEDCRRVADRAVAFTVADRVRVGIEIETVLRRPVTVRDDDRPAIPVAEDAASIAVAGVEATTLHRTGRIAAFYCKTACVRVADKPANAATAAVVVVCRDCAKAAAARERQFRLYNADDAARVCAR